MKFYLTMLVLVFVITKTSAQVTVGTRMFGTFQDFEKGEYDIIKNKTTVFVIDDLDVVEFKRMIQDVWTYNDYIVIERKDYNENSYVSDKYAPFLVEGFVKTTTKTNTTTGSLSTIDRVSIYHHYYYYRKKQRPSYMHDTGKFSKNYDTYRKRTIAGVFYASDVDTTFETIDSNSIGNMSEGYNNYALGYIKNYFQKINKEFSTKGYSFAYDEDYDKKKMKALKKNTLYIPDFIKLKYNAWVGSSNFGEHEREEPGDLFKSYEHPYEWISKEDLNKKIIEAEEDFYYLMYVRLNGQKIIAVHNGYTGDIIYQDYQTLSYNIKRKDIRRISSKIK